MQYSSFSNRYDLPMRDLVSRLETKSLSSSNDFQLLTYVPNPGVDIFSIVVDFEVFFINLIELFLVICNFILFFSTTYL